MRSLRAIGSVLAIVAVFTVVGTGYAAFASSAYLNGSASAGTLGPLVWGPEPGAGGYESYNVCTVTVGTTTQTGDTLFLTASNLAPGDICSYGDSLANLGSLPAVAGEVVTHSSGGLCSALAYGDNFFSPSIVLGPGGQTSPLTHSISANGGIPLQWEGFVHFLPNSGNGYSGQSCAFTITLTASAGS